MRRELIRAVVLVVILCCALIPEAHSQSVERLMREIQARNFYLQNWRASVHGLVPEDSGDYPVGAPTVDVIAWPDCCDEDAPIFPNDGFYDVPMQDPTFAVLVTQSIAAGIYEIIGSFIAPDSVYPGTSGFETIANSSIEFMGGYVSDEPFNPSSGWIKSEITEENYQEFLSEFARLVDQLTIIEIIIDPLDDTEGVDVGKQWASQTRQYFEATMAMACDTNVILGPCFPDRTSPDCDTLDLLDYLRPGSTPDCDWSFTGLSNWCSSPVDTVALLLNDAQDDIDGTTPSDTVGFNAQILENYVPSTDICVSGIPNFVTTNYLVGESIFIARQDPIPHEGSAKLWLYVYEEDQNRVVNSATGETVIIHTPPVEGVWNAPLTVKYFPFGTLDPSTSSGAGQIEVGSVTASPDWGFDQNNLKLFGDLVGKVYDINHHRAGWTLSGQSLLLTPDWPMGEGNPGKCVSCCTLLAAQQTQITTGNHDGEPPETPSGCAAVPPIEPENTEEGAGCPETDAEAAQEASVDDAGAGEEGGCDTCDDTGSGGGEASNSTSVNSNPATDQPVLMAEGHKIEFATDLRVSLPGQDFSLRREYSSKPDLNGPDVVGNNWILPVTRMIEEAAEGELILHGNVRGHLKFTKQDGVANYWADSATTTYAEPMTDGDSDSIWRLTKPGVREVDFYDYSTANVTDGLAGFIKEERDYFGRVWSYDYFDIGPSGGEAKRLNTITVTAGGDTLAVIAFTWISEHPDRDLAGKLRRVDVYRFPDGGLPVLTQWAEYTYAAFVNAISRDVSDLAHGDSHDSPPDGNLVQVTVGTRVDEFDFEPVSANDDTASPEADYPFRVQITQYRYHPSEDYDPGSGSTGDGPLFVWDTYSGNSGRLKSVIMPQQIEYFADKWNSGAQSPELVLREAATLLMTKDDDWSAVNSSSTALNFQPVDLCAKVIDYGSTAKVVAQYTLSDCGCGGGSALGSVDLYTYTTYSSGGVIGGTTRIERKIKDSSGDFTDLYLTRYIEYDRFGSSTGVPYRIADVTIADSDSRTWVERWLYEPDTNLSGIDVYLNDEYHTPEVYSGSSSYTPGTSTPPTFVPGTYGLVRRYTYNSDYRLTDIGISNDPSGMATVIPIKRITYPSSPGTNERSYLPTKVEWNRSDTHTNWVTQNDIETVTYAYGFKASTDELAWVERSVESELVTENGPASATTYSRYHIYDDYGQIAWTRAEDLSMVFYKRDPATGAVLKSVQNADKDGPAGETEDLFVPPTGIGSTSNWGDPDPGGELSTTYTHDLLGRTVSMTTPAGVTTYTRRGFLRNGTTGDNGVLVYAMTTLPPGDTDERAGPISRTWYDARGNVVRRSQFLADVSGGQEYDPASGDYAIDTGNEVSRAESDYNASGLRTKARQYEDVGDDLFPSGGSGSIYETEFTYDKLGRVSTVTDPTLTKTESVYDELGRVIVQKLGTNSVTPVTVAEYIYDSDSGTPSTAGAGNGLVTMVRMYDGSTIRETEYTYDFRNRLIVTAPPEPPYETTEYDNLDRVVSRSIFEDASLTTRGRYEESVYGQRGRMVRSKIAIDPTDTTPDFIESAMWLDEKGRVLKQLSPDNPVSKYEYDNLDRVTKVSLTDGRNDALPGVSGSHADAGSIADDTVFQQTQYTYDSDGHVQLQTVYSRLHDETGYGALDNTSSIITYAGTVYDRFERPVASINFGTNMPSSEILETSGTSTVPTMPADLDELDGTTYNHTIYTITTYDDRGRVSLIKDPEERKTAYFYDDLNRTIATVEAFDDADFDGWDNTDGIWRFDSGLSDNGDDDRATSFVYDGVGNVVKRVAHTSDSTEQVTEYVYGVTTSGSDIDSNHLLSKVHYPNESTGAADTSSAYTVTYTYNRLGEVKSVLDQNGTTHTYTRDDLGRVTIDSVSLGTDVDDFVKSLGYAFDDFGRVETMTSYASTNASGTVRNQVKLEYTDLWQVERVLQSHAGAVEVNGSNQPINDTRAVAYAYTNEKLADGNHARPSTVTYPTIAATSWTSDITYEYGASAGSADDLISRPTVLDFDDSGQGVEYTYLGLSAPAVIDYPVPDVQLDRTFSHDGKRNVFSYTQNAGKYPGWDPFMRVRLQTWMDGNLTEDSPSAGFPNVPTILEERYVYSKASNRLARLDTREGAKWTARDFKFDYDGLHRLIEVQRGEADDPFAPDPLANYDASGAAGGKSQEWGLDALGNWSTFANDLDEDATYDDLSSSSTDEVESRTHNKANELTMRTLGSGLGVQERAYYYDNNGNRITNVLLSSSVGTYYVYDAWNRLVRVELRESGGSPPPPVIISRSEYNAAWWRVFHEADTDLPSDGLDEEYVMVYGAGWQLVQEIIDSSTDNARDRTMEYFWGLRGIDDIAHRRLTIDRNEDTTWETERYYHVTDPLFSTVAVVNQLGNLIERVTYDAYGKARHHPMWDIDRDGDVDGNDISAWASLFGGSYVIGDDEYNADADPDRNGQYDMSDYSQLSGAQAYALPRGFVSSLDYSDNRVGYAGYLRVEEAQLYCVRFRHYDEDAGRWMQRDPLHTDYLVNIRIGGSQHLGVLQRNASVAPFWGKDLANLYQYARSNPVTRFDPMGLKCCIAVRCHNLTKIGITYASHCGLVFCDDSGCYSYDGSGGDTHLPGINPFDLNNPPLAGKVGTMNCNFSDSICSCLRSEQQRWRNMKIPRDNLCANSNWHLNCVTKKCGIKITWGTGEHRKPRGWDCESYKDGSINCIKGQPYDSDYWGPNHTPIKYVEGRSNGCP